MVEKLQDTVLSISTENAKNKKKIIENLTKNVFDQERRLEILEKICKICGLLFYEINKINFLCLIQTKVEHYIPLPF